MARTPTVLIFLILSTALFPSFLCAEIPGFYISLQTGYTESNINVNNLVSVTSGASGPLPLPQWDSYHFTYRVGMGYQIDPNLALEGGYTRLNKTQQSPSWGTNYSIYASSSPFSVDFLAKGLLPFPHSVTGYGKIGLAYVNPRSYGQGSGSLTITPHVYKTTVLPAFAVGLSYALAPNIPIDISWNRVQHIGKNSYPPNNDFFALGTAYYFG